MKSGRVFALVLAAALGGGLARAQDVMLLTEYDGSVLRFDVASQQVTEIRPLAVSQLNAATVGPGGSVFAANDSNIYQIDTATGAASFVFAAFDVRGLAFVPASSTFYAIRDNGGLSNDTVIAINAYTGSQSPLGGSGNSALQSLSYGADGVMYGYSVTGGLGTINTGTGAWTDINVGQAGTVDIQAIEEDSEGRLWGFGNGLFRIDRFTGVHTLVASGLFNSVRGAALLKPNYPVLGIESGAILDISSDTGRGFSFSTTAVVDTGSASAPDRRVYFLIGSTSTLWYRDPGSGFLFNAGSIGLTGWTAMAYQPGADRMLAIRRNAGVDILYAIDYATGAPTLIGTTGTNTIEGLAVSSAGAIYAWSTTIGLMTLNPATGAATDVNGSVGGSNFIRSLDFAPDGRLCGFGNGIWDINSAGRFIRIGGSGYTQVETAAFVPDSGRMRGIENLGSFFDIFDVAQGNGALIGATSGSNSLTVGPDGNLYGENGGNLTQYDPVTGAATNVLNLGLTLTGLTRRGTEMFAIRSTAPNDTIVKWEPPLNIVTSLPMSNLSGLQALATSPNGTLFGWDVVAGLVTIDPVTGQATDVNVAAAGSANTQSIEFLPDFTLLGVRDSYFRFNPATGNSVTFPGGPYTDIRGMAYVGTRVRGRARLEDYSGPIQNQVVTVELRHPNSDVTVETHHCRLTPLGGNTGEYSFTSFRQGSYRAYVKGSHWLRRTSGFVNVFQWPDANNANITSVLENGDIDGDNEVGIGDYAQLSAAYGSVPGDPNWEPNADLNGDDSVDIGDYAILSANFGLIGDN